jgi:hypothetical protein
MGSNSISESQQKRLEIISQKMVELNFTKAELISLAALALDLNNNGSLLASTTTLYAVKGVMAERKEANGADTSTEL